MICYEYRDATDDYIAQPVPTFTSTVTFTATKTDVRAPRPFE